MNVNRRKHYTSLQPNVKFWSVLYDEVKS